MSNMIQSNPGVFDLREDYSGWNAEIDPNPAAQARAEYENDLYIDAIRTDRESIDVETAQPLSPVREGAQVNNLERVPAGGEVHAYATNDGRAIDPADTEAVLSSARETVNAALGNMTTLEQTASTAHDMQEYAALGASRAKVYGAHLDIMRNGADALWQSENN